MFGEAAFGGDFHTDFQFQAFARGELGEDGGVEFAPLLPGDLAGPSYAGECELLGLLLLAGLRALVALWGRLGPLFLVAGLRLGGWRGRRGFGFNVSYQRGLVDRLQHFSGKGLEVFVGTVYRGGMGTDGSVGHSEEEHGFTNLLGHGH